MERKVAEKKRIYFLKAPVDIVDEESSLSLISRMLDEGGSRQVMFLNLKSLFRSRRDMLYYKSLYESALILPTSRGIIRGVRFLKHVRATRYNPFDYIISLLSFAEKNGHSVYFYGGRKDDLEKAERNVRTSFPGLKIIGRYAGYISPQTERNVMTAIQKATPAFLLVGRGVKSKELWLYRNRQEFKKGVVIWVDDCIEIFAGRKKYVGEKLFAAGFESLSGIFKRPWRFFRFFQYLYFNILLLLYKLFRL